MELEKMTLEDFWNHRKERKFTANEIIAFLEKRGCRCRLVDTGIPGNRIKSKGPWDMMCWENQKAGCEALCTTLKKEGTPTDFAYIKFYTEHGYKEGTDGAADHIYALCAGKTKRTGSGPDLRFWTLKKRATAEKVKKDIRIECLANISKKWLNTNTEYRWYHEKILIVWLPEAEKRHTRKEIKNLAYSAEADIMGFFGLFGS